MSRRASRCTEAELKRAIKAALASVSRVVVEIPVDGPIRIITDRAEQPLPGPQKRRIAL